MKTDTNNYCNDCAELFEGMLQLVVVRMLSEKCECDGCGEVKWCIEYKQEANTR